MEARHVEIQVRDRLRRGFGLTIRVRGFHLVENAAVEYLADTSGERGIALTLRWPDGGVVL